MKIALIVVGALATLVLIVLVIGASLPKQHSASRSAVFKKDRRAVYDVIRNVGAGAQWREGVQKVDVLDDKHFREHSKMGAMTFEVGEDDPGRRMVTTIVDRDLGFGGSWTYLLEDAPGGTRLTITENGEISNVFFRFMARFVFGYTATMETYLKSLERRLA